MNLYVSGTYGGTFRESSAACTAWGGICPTIKSRDYKDPVYILEEVDEVEVKKVGNIYGFEGGSFAGNVYDENGLAPAIRTMEGGNREPMIVRLVGRNPDNPKDRKSKGIKLEQMLEPNEEGICGTLTSVDKDNMVLETVRIKQATEAGFVECKVGGVADLSYPSSTTRRGRVQDGGDVAPALTVSGVDGICKIESKYRIRKLIPLECWRLMGFTDEEFHKAETVNSNTQLYKQAGNSIVVDVLAGIFGEIINAMEDAEMKKIEEVKTIKFETDKMIDLAALAEKEPELFEELAADYPCENARYIFDVKSVG